jgi:murein DD-endopeptidase MepM/ murein hydrolase activator NlpD
MTVRAAVAGQELAALVLATAACGGGTPGPPVDEVCTGYPDWQSSPYVLPYPVGTSYLVRQGNCSGFGHSGVYAYSYDVAMDLGTTVTAARDGTVAEVRTGHVDGDLTPGHENFVKIRDADDVLTAYSHLGTDGVLVGVGDVVVAGDVIGRSGNTGETGGVPHLHFHLSSCSEPVDCGTLPITFRNTTPDPVGLVAGQVYPAEPY